MSRELDEACAKAMGWTKVTLHKGYRTTTLRALRPDRHYVTVPLFSSTNDGARLLEDDVERRGLFNHYTFALGRQVGVADDAWQSRDTLIALTWLLLRATPEQRARAFLEAVK